MSLNALDNILMARIYIKSFIFCKLNNSKFCSYSPQLSISVFKVFYNGKVNLKLFTFLLSHMSHSKPDNDRQKSGLAKTSLSPVGELYWKPSVEKLVSLGANVTVVDDLSSGNLENLSTIKNKIKFIKKDLEYIEKDEIREIFREKNIVFHLAAVHGGRGYIQTHPADVCSNLSIDHHVFEAIAESSNSMENLVFASTACVYPPDMQKKGSSYQ